MLNLASLTHTLPMLIVGMAGIFLVIGVLILTVTLLNRVTEKKEQGAP